MRSLYTALLYALTPVVIGRLAWRGVQTPAYLERWGERFARDASPAPAPNGVWLHAVSFGEVQAAAPLVRALRERHPDLAVTLTTMTPTGSARARELFGDDVHHVYVPYDLPGAVARFLQRVRPALALVMETEIWPNLFAGCAQRGIPVIVANARLSPRSFAGYRRVRALARQTLQHVALVAAQSEADAERFRTLGAPRVEVTGSVKFDMAMPPAIGEEGEALRAMWGANRDLIVAGSTHEGEESQVLDAFARVRQARPRALLVLVPRHPERFERVGALCESRGFAMARRSLHDPVGRDTAVYLADTMGELLRLYAAADVAYVGGSLIKHGGHNALEAAALGVPVVFGPHTFNFEEISRWLEEAGAARRVPDADGLAQTLIEWLGDAPARHEAGEHGREVIARNRGALDRLIAIVERHLP